MREHLGDKMAPPTLGLDVTHGELVRAEKQVLAFYVRSTTRGCMQHLRR